MISARLVFSHSDWLVGSRKTLQTTLRFQSNSTFFYTPYRVDHKPQQGKYDLFITKANYNRDNGQFKCSLKEAGTGIELHSKSVELTVLLKPSPPSISPDNATATEGKPLNLTCASIGGKSAVCLQILHRYLHNTLKCILSHINWDYGTKFWRRKKNTFEYLVLQVKMSFI